jgi:hypothetical protein
MELTYDSMVAFMRDYFPAYSDFGQDPATVHRMHDYYTPDFVFTGYVGLPEPSVYADRASFLEFDISHPSSYERLTVEDMTVDERRGTVFAIIKFEFVDTSTGAVLAEERGATKYQLVLDEAGTIKVSSFVFFAQRLPQGTLSGTEIFRRDRRPE